ncbi:unnamed protein product [Prunus armeniaca]|uniref:Uncharacterized protein n=1 Tax=Prunus armeniaca TaxID=36596 RepID=A0A6J5WGV8_PRUAR|nr:unnamed protein product [Prunus armeniaca]CAB4299107.1 unnamed protein product [Prunus armeniaca]
MKDEEGVVSQRGLIALAQGCLELEYLMNKVGPLLFGLVFWCLPLSGPMSTMTKTGLLLSGWVNSTKKTGPLVSDMKKKKGLVVSEMEG